MGRFRRNHGHAALRLKRKGDFLTEAIMIENKVVQLFDHREPQVKSPQVKSQYERYPLPFFDAARLSTWAVKPTGRSSEDLGRAYAAEFLKSCDCTEGWRTLLAVIVGDMIRAGSSGNFADGTAKIDGVVIGFMSMISEALILAKANRADLLEMLIEDNAKLLRTT